MQCRKCKKEIPEGSNYCCWCGIKQQKIKSKRMNGEGCIYPYQTGKGTRYKVDITLGYSTDKDGRTVRERHTKAGFKTQKAAVEYISQIKTAGVVRKDTLASYYPQVQVATIDKLQSEDRKRKYALAYKRIADIADTPIVDLRLADLQECVSGYGFDSAKDIKTLLRQLYKYAIIDGVVVRNVAEDIALPKQPKSERRAFTKDDISKFWDSFNNGDWFCGYILFMIYTGAMPGEVRIMTKDMFNFEKRTVTGAGLKTTERKNRSIVFPSQIIPMIQTLFTHSKTDKFLAISESGFYDHYNHSVEAAGVTKLPAYSCRHTTATALAELDVNPEHIKQIMRHANIATTQRYIHLNNETASKAIEKLTEYE